MIKLRNGNETKEAKDDEIIVEDDNDLPFSNEFIDSKQLISLFDIMIRF